MAFKFKTFAAVGALIGSLALVGCGQDEKDPNHIKVGVIVGAEQQVAETAQTVAKEKYGLDVELVTFNDYVLPNEALSKGDIDANAFQHKPYLDQQINALFCTFGKFVVKDQVKLGITGSNPFFQMWKFLKGCFQRFL